MRIKRLVWLLLCLLAVAQGYGQIRDSVMLQNVSVTGKSKAQRLREGVLTVNVIDVRSVIGSISSLGGLIDRTAGVKLREDGGVGSDFDLSINGMSGNSVRYFIDGVPLDTKGSGVTLANLPVGIVDHVEIYKGVVPTWLSSDALGGAVNIVTKRVGDYKSPLAYLDASYGFGSYGTHRADLSGQYVTKNGLIVRPTLGISYSKNNYMMKGVELWDETTRKYLPQDRRRFHDDYFSALGQMEVGVTGRRWADEAFLHISYNKIAKDIQTGQIQSRVIGMADRETHAWSIGANYRKHHLLTDGLNLSVQLSHTWDHSVTTDTAYRKYDWNGDYIYSARSEITGRERTRRHYKRPLTIAHAELNYVLTEEHALNLNYALNRTGNERWDDVEKGFEPANDVLAKHIAGLAYNQSLFSGRMNNTFFLKDYINHLSIQQTDIPTVTGSREVLGSNTKNHLGYGVGTRLNSQFSLPHSQLSLGLKASYEHSVRLPLARELLGNGTTIYANVALKPESSDNVNLGLFGTLQSGRHTLSCETGGFLRFSDDYIQPQVSEKEGMMQYVNVSSVYIKGLEAELRYDWARDEKSLPTLQLLGNISWQDARDRQRLKSDGKPSVTFNNHVPNRPWLFASAGVRYSLGRLFQADDRLTLAFDYQWVHWFFLSWEGYGRLDTKARIPEKNIVGANVTYAWCKHRYSFSLDCQNLFDTTVYDNYKLQKPGRTFFAKFRLFLQ